VIATAQLTRSLRKLSFSGYVSGLLLILVLLVVALPGVFATHNPTVPDFGSRLTAPSLAHWFGTDELGRDIYSRIIHGTRISFLAAVGIVLITVLIGVPLGLVSGYTSGPVSETIMRVSDIFIAFPSLIMAMAIVAVLGPGIENAIIALALVWWPQYTRLVRAQVLQLKQLPYIEAVNALGASGTRVVFRHLLPNSVTPLIVKISLDIGVAILSLASFSFLGLGAAPPSPELGSLVSQGRDFFLDAWWYTTFPGAVILLIGLVFNTLADDLRDVLDPSLRYN
jgi:peptide/nickel transport system permease protein